jgi:predicted DNA-binding protein (MmcQ/YjbR family)
VGPSEPSLDAAVAGPLSSRRGTGSGPEGAGRAGEQVMTDSLRDRVIAACSAKPGSVEDYPFGNEVAVFKVAGKMFALVTMGPAPGSVSLKCDPDLAAGLRRRYAAITAGYHLSKRHWNTVTLDCSVPEDELLDLIDHSYELVVARLPRAERDKLNT